MLRVFNIHKIRLGWNTSTFTTPHSVVILLIFISFLVNSCNSNPTQSTNNSPSQSSNIPPSASNSTIEPTPESSVTLIPSSNITPDNSEEENEESMDGLPLLPSIGQEAIDAANISRLEKVAQWGNGTINKVAFSPNGDLVAVATSLGIDIYDSNNSTLLVSNKTDYWVNDIDFSPDGTKLAASGPGILEIWNYSNNSLQLLWTKTDYQLLPIDSKIKFSHDNQIIYLLGGTTIKMWMASDGQLLDQYSLDLFIYYPTAFSPDGSLMASFRVPGNFIDIHNVSSGQLTASIKEINTPQEGIAISSDNSLVAYAVEDSTNFEYRINIADIASGNFINSFVLNPSIVVTNLQFTPSDSKLVIGTQGRAIYVWDFQSDSDPIVIVAHHALIRDITVSNDSQKFASGSWDGSVKIWQTGNGNLLSNIQNYSSNISSVVYSSDNKMVGIGAGSKITIYDLLSGQILQEIDLYNELTTTRSIPTEVADLAFSPDNQVLAIATNSIEMLLWDISSGTMLKEFYIHAPQAYIPYIREVAIAFSPDGKTLFMAEDNGVSAWSLDQTRHSNIAHIETGHVTSNIALSPNGTIGAVVTSDGNVQVFQPSNNSLITSLYLNEQSVKRVYFSENGQILFTSDSSGLLTSWDTQTWMPISSIDLPFLPWIVFSDNRISVGYGGNMIYLWDNTQDRPLGGLPYPYFALSVFDREVSPVKGISLSSNGTTLTVWSFNGTVQFWQLN